MISIWLVISTSAELHCRNNSSSRGANPETSYKLTLYFKMDESGGNRLINSAKTHLEEPFVQIATGVYEWVYIEMIFTPTTNTVPYGFQYCFDHFWRQIGKHC